MAVVKQRAYITVHDKSTQQSNFSNNGLAILQPTVCRITEVLNGTYELYLEHPIIENDPRVNHIKVDNIIKADGQLFRIREANRKLSQNGDKILTAKALHIWYDLADRYISEYNIDAWAPYWFMENMAYHVSAEVDLEYMRLYNFTGTTHMGANPDPGVPLAYSHFKDSNPVACYIGTENSFVSIYNREVNGVYQTPELYRDNFNFSLEWRKENSVDNAFNIIHKVDMTEIAETVDIKNLITRLFVRDNYGHSTQFKINPAAIIAAGGWLPAHHRTKAVELQYNAGENDQYIAQRFAKDAERYFKQMSTVKLSYKCNYAELSNTELYKDYIAAKHCNVGDTGTIVCEALGITATNMEVVRKEKDVLKNETISLEFGTKSASLTDPKFMSQTVNNSKFNYSEVLPIGDVPNS